MVFSLYTASSRSETSTQLNLESGFSFAFSTSPLSFSPSGDLSGSGDRCAAVFIHPQCFPNSTLLTHTRTHRHTSGSLSSCFIPSLSLCSYSNSFSLSLGEVNDCVASSSFFFLTKHQPHLTEMWTRHLTSRLLVCINWSCRSLSFLVLLFCVLERHAELVWQAQLPEVFSQHKENKKKHFFCSWIHQFHIPN